MPTQSPDPKFFCHITVGFSPPLQALLHDPLQEGAGYRGEGGRDDLPDGLRCENLVSEVKYLGYLRKVPHTSVELGEKHTTQLYFLIC